MKPEMHLPECITMPICIGNHMISSAIWLSYDWLLLGFYRFLSQSEPICNLHRSVTHFAPVLRKSFTPFLANQNQVNFVCILLC